MRATRALVVVGRRLATAPQPLPRPPPRARWVPPQHLTARFFADDGGKGGDGGDGEEDQEVEEVEKAEVDVETAKDEDRPKALGYFARLAALSQDTSSDEDVDFEGAGDEFEDGQHPLDPHNVEWFPVLTDQMLQGNNDQQPTDYFSPEDLDYMANPDLTEDQLEDGPFSDEFDERRTEDGIDLAPSVVKRGREIEPLGMCPGGKQRRGHRLRTCELIDVDDLHYTNIALFNFFLSDGGAIQPRRMTGLCNRCQRKLRRVVKQARDMCIIPTIQDFEVDDKHNVDVNDWVRELRPPTVYHLQRESTLELQQARWAEVRKQLGRTY